MAETADLVQRGNAISLIQQQKLKYKPIYFEV